MQSCKQIGGVSWGARGRVAFGLAAAALAAASAARATAATTAYSNVTNFTAVGYVNGAPATTSGVDYTPLVADDITPVTGLAGLPVSTVEFSVYNGNATAVTVIPELRFYATDGTGSTGAADGLPGSLLYGVNLLPTSVPAGSSLDALSLPTTGANVFDLPSGTFYAGLAFTDGGTTGATAAQLANFGQLTFAPPTVGSSNDYFFQSSGTGPFTSANPAGQASSFGGNPTADFGWAFTVAVPEPASAGLLAVGAVAAVGRRRRR